MSDDETITGPRPADLESKITPPAEITREPTAGHHITVRCGRYLREAAHAECARRGTTLSAEVVAFLTRLADGRDAECQRECTGWHREDL